jgi:hypothetical protein
MDLVKICCAANNQGVSLLAAGKSQAALFSLHRALTTVKQVAGSHTDMDDEEEPDGSVNEPASDTFAVVEVDETSCSLELSSGDGYCYGRPLLIHSATTSESAPCDTTSLTIYSAVILFNMAIACHHVGRSGKESAFKRAAGLYAMSIQILSGEMDGAFGEARRLSSVVSLLALNNRAQILYHELCDYAQCRRCLKDMARLIQGNQASRVVPALQSSLAGRDVEGILLNLMLLKVPSGAQAA